MTRGKSRSPGVFLRGNRCILAFSRYSSPRATKSCLPQNTTAHFSGFNSRYDTLLVVVVVIVRLTPRVRASSVPAYVLRTCVLAEVRVCERTCARMQPRKAFLFRDERRRRCRVSDKHEQHACLRKISGMSLHTPRGNAVMQSLGPRRSDFPKNRAGPY